LLYDDVACNPAPADQTQFVPLNTQLTWSPALPDVTHDVYLGTDQTSVCTAARLPGDIDGSRYIDFLDLLILAEHWLHPPDHHCLDLNDDTAVNLLDFATLAANWKQYASHIYHGNQDANSFTPANLEKGRTYYWRIDEVNGCQIRKGPVWSFTTDPYLRFELIHDPNFQNGLRVIAPELGPNRTRIVERILQWTGCQGSPRWNLAQWHSNFSIADAGLDYLPPGAVRVANEAKTVIVGMPETPDAHLDLRVDSWPEYDGQARQAGQPWPHLLVDQSLSQRPSLAELFQLQFHIEAILRYAYQYPSPDYAPSLHCAQYHVTFILQNLNESSAGYGDFLWFQVPLYDSRWQIPPPYISQDTADPSAKLIYNPGGQAYTSETLHDGYWLTVDKDLRLLLLDALQAAWDRGYLQDSQDPADYCLSSIIIGWEVPGLNEVEIQIRNLSLQAITSAASN